jgi:histidyl-tRNA synthetase
MLKRLGIDKDRYKIEVNSVGCNSCRESFRGDVVTYFNKRKEGLCEDCVRRLERNPLRIFDCKNDKCIEISRGAPLIADSLCEGCEGHLEGFLRSIESLGLSVVVNKRLVRGIDYYTKTVFEVTSVDLGAQNAFIAGGRYDNLVKEVGGPDVPGIGFAIGMERLSMLIEPIRPHTRPFVFFAWLGERAYGYIMPLMKAFTDNGIGLFYSYEAKSLKSQMRYADSINSTFVLIIGDEEIDRGVAILRDMSTKTQYELPIDIPGLVKEVSRHLVPI